MNALAKLTIRNLRAEIKNLWELWGELPEEWATTRAGELLESVGALSESGEDLSQEKKLLDECLNGSREMEQRIEDLKGRVAQLEGVVSMLRRGRLDPGEARERFNEVLRRACPECRGG